MTQKEHFYFIDLLRALAIAMVVLSHSCSPLVWQVEDAPFGSWIILVFINSFIRSGVPLFVLITGALSLKPEPVVDWRAYFKKRVMLVFLPTLVWSVIYLTWNTHAGVEPEFSKYVLLDLLAMPAARHLWFMYMFLGLVLVTPLVRVFLVSATRRDVWYAVGLFVGSTTLVIAVKEFLKINISEWFYLPFGYWGYFLMGYALNQIPASRLRKGPLGFSVVFLTCLTATGTILLSFRDDWHFNNFFNDNLGPFTTATSAVAFLFFKSLDVRGFFERFQRLGQALTSIAHHSFGIYLAHALVIQFLAWGYLGAKISWKTIHSLVGVPLTAGLTLVLSWGLCLLLSRHPLLNSLFLGRPRR